MTHILKVSCGGKVFAKEFEEKVLFFFFEKERKSTGGTEEEEGREREKGENPLELYDTNPQNLLWWYGFCKRT